MINTGDLFGVAPIAKIAPRDLLAVYDAEYRKRYQTAAPIVGKKDAPLAARLLKLYSFDELSSWLRLYFDVPDKFIQNSGYTFGVFSACIAKVIQFDRRRSARVVAAPVVATDAVVRVMREKQEIERLDGIEMANAYYAKRPWLQR